MFGAKPAANPFGTTTTAFGQPAAPTSAPSSGFNFGTPPTQPAAGTTGGGLFSSPASNPFGSTSTSTQQPGQTGGLFGSTSTPQQPPSFGSTSTQQQQQPAAGGFSFGGASSTFGGGFGGQQQQQQPSNTGGGLFSGFGAQQSQNTGGLFASTSTNPFGGQQQQQQPASDIIYLDGQPGRLGLNSIWVPEGPLTRRCIPKDETFKFTTENDPQLAAMLREMESELVRQKQTFDDINSGTLANDVFTTERQTEGLHSGFLTYKNAFKDLETRTTKLQGEVNGIQGDFDKAVAVLQWQISHPDDTKGFEAVRNNPADFFIQIAKDCRDRAEGYRKTLDQIERQLQSLWNNQSLPSAQAISQSMSNNQDLIMALAAQVAEIDDRVKQLVDLYRQRYREKYHTIVDPVNERRRIDGVPAKGYSGDRDDGVLASMAGMGFR